MTWASHFPSLYTIAGIHEFHMPVDEGGGGDDDAGGVHHQDEDDEADDGGQALFWQQGPC